MKPFCYDRCLRPDRPGIFNISDYCLGMINNWGAHLLDQVQRWAEASGRKDPPVHYEGSGQFSRLAGVPAGSASRGPWGDLAGIRVPAAGPCAIASAPGRMARKDRRYIILLLTQQPFRKGLGKSNAFQVDLFDPHLQCRRLRLQPKIARLQ